MVAAAVVAGFLIAAPATAAVAAEPSPRSSSESTGILPAAPTATDSTGVAAAAVLGDTLSRGETLEQGDSLQSASGQFTLFVDGVGSLVLEKAANRLAGPYGVELADGGAGARLDMQTDGNLVFYSAAGEVVFETVTYGTDAAGLTLQNDGNLVIYGAGGALASFGTYAFSFLSAGGTLLPDERLESDDRGTRLVMQGDGNLVLYTGTSVRFSSNTFVAGSAAVLQADGNFVVYSPDNTPLFSTGSSPGPVELGVTDREFAVISLDGGLTGTVLYSSEWSKDTFEPGMFMGPGDRRTAAGGAVQLIFQTDGNLVLYVNGAPEFFTGVSDADFVAMQEDGNVVLYNIDDSFGLSAVSESETAGNPGSRLVVQSDGNLVVYTPDNRPVFSIL